MLFRINLFSSSLFLENLFGMPIFTACGWEEQKPFHKEVLMVVIGCIG